MSVEKSIWTRIRRRLRLRCPNCGKGRLFAGYLKIKARCDVCGTDNSIYPSDDFPPYLTILLAGHIVLPLFVVTDSYYALPFWLSGIIWLPMTLALCPALLPFMKGATAGLCWATDLIRQDVPR